MRTILHRMKQLNLHRHPSLSKQMSRYSRPKLKRRPSRRFRYSRPKLKRRPSRRFRYSRPKLKHHPSRKFLNSLLISIHGKIMS